MLPVGARESSFWLVSRPDFANCSFFQEMCEVHAPDAWVPEDAEQANGALVSCIGKDAHCRPCRGPRRANEVRTTLEFLLQLVFARISRGLGLLTAEPWLTNEAQ